MNLELNISLTVEEINNILQALGQLPTSSNAYPLFMKIKSQAEQRFAEIQNQPNVENTENG